MLVLGVLPAFQRTPLKPSPSCRPLGATSGSGRPGLGPRSHAERGGACVGAGPGGRGLGRGRPPVQPRARPAGGAAAFPKARGRRGGLEARGSGSARAAAAGCAASVRPDRVHAHVSRLSERPSHTCTRRRSPAQSTITRVTLPAPHRVPRFRPVPAGDAFRRPGVRLSVLRALTVWDIRVWVRPPPSSRMGRAKPSGRRPEPESLMGGQVLSWSWAAAGLAPQPCRAQAPSPPGQL